MGYSDFLERLERMKKTISIESMRKCSMDALLFCGHLNSYRGDDDESARKAVQDFLDTCLVDFFPIFDKDGSFNFKYEMEARYIFVFFLRYNIKVFSVKKYINGHPIVNQLIDEMYEKGLIQDLIVVDNYNNDIVTSETRLFDFVA
jgi:hypothetical protein